MALSSVIRHMQDQPWEGWQLELWGTRVTLMSSAIASMILVGIVLAVGLAALARRHQKIPRGAASLLDVVVIFVRDMIARPALGDRTYEHLPFLLTLFVFILGMNLMGIVPLESLSALWPGHPIGKTATSVPAVCAALACLALLRIILSGLRTQAQRLHEARGVPTPLCLAVSPILWLRSLSPSLPGVAGKVLAVPLIALEVLGALAKCFSLMVRLCANMLSGHTLLAVLMMMLFEMTATWIQRAYVGPWVIAGSVAINLLELLVAGLQAYIFTFLTAMFLGLYAVPSH